LFPIFLKKNNNSTCSLVMTAPCPFLEISVFTFPESSFKLDINILLKGRQLTANSRIYWSVIILGWEENNVGNSVNMFLIIYIIIGPLEKVYVFTVVNMKSCTSDGVSLFHCFSNFVRPRPGKFLNTFPIFVKIHTLNWHKY